MNKEKIFSIADKLEWTVYDMREHGFDVEEGKHQFEFRKYSPEGEDFSFLIEVEDVADIPKEVDEYFDSFDVEEHFKMWIEAKDNKVSGIPGAFELVEDAKAIKKMIGELADALIGRKSGCSDEFKGCLESLLQKHFGCKRPFYKKPAVVTDFGNGVKKYEYMTRSGGKAYSKLVDLIYDLGSLLPDLVDSNEIIECLDDIVSSQGY